MFFKAGSYWQLMIQFLTCYLIESYSLPHVASSQPLLSNINMVRRQQQGFLQMSLMQNEHDGQPLNHNKCCHPRKE